MDRQARSRLIGAEHVHERQRLQQRLDIVEVEGVDVVEVLQHRLELGGVALQLVGGEVEPGELGHVGHVGPGDVFGHGVEC